MTSPLVEKIEVFLSSRQKEFSAERKSLQRKISRIPFLVCRLLERRGASPMFARRASIAAVRRFHIYVGIFGTQYSDISKSEYLEAFRRHKPCLIYIKNVKKRERERETRLTEFIDERVKLQWQMYPFDTKTELYNMVTDNLRDNIMELLQMGLEKYRADQRKRLRMDKAIRKQLDMTLTAQKEIVPSEMLSDALNAIKRDDPVSAIVKASISLESWLRRYLSRKTDVPESELKRRPLGYLINLGTKNMLLSSHDVNVLREVQYARNRTIHKGITPSNKDVKWIVEALSALTNSRNHELV